MLAGLMSCLAAWVIRRQSSEEEREESDCSESYTGATCLRGR